MVKKRSIQNSYSAIVHRGKEIGVEVEIMGGKHIEIESILKRTIHEVEIIVEIGVGQDNHTPN